MTPLQAFLVESAHENHTKEVHLKGRLASQTFIIKGLTLGEWTQARKRAVNPEAEGEDRLSGIEMTKQTIIAGCIEPNFKDSEFIQSCGCVTPSELIDKVLLSGEATQLANKIMITSGFEDNSDKLKKAKEEAKN